MVSRAFLGQAPLCVLAAVNVYFILDLPKVDRSNWKKEVAKVDFLGAFSLIVAVSVSLM